MRILTLILLALLVTACSSTSRTKDGISQEWLYECDDSSQLHVVYINQPNGQSYAVLSFHDRIVTLSVSRSASGALYIDPNNPDGVQWHTKADYALLSNDSDPHHVECRSGTVMAD